MRNEFIEEKFILRTPEIEANKGEKIKVEVYLLGELMFQITFEELGKRIKKEFEEYSEYEDEDIGRRLYNKYIKEKGIDVELRRKTDTPFFIIFPAYAFIIWALPIIVFSLLGIVFKKK